ncbi:transposable element Tcb1 transposase [Trichonephila clavipes]|nr:transposable element Tcb1 transposase [Trichonephila clavipes]
MWAAEWNDVVFIDESRICLQHHDGRIRVWRHRGERMLNSCVMHHHTGPAPGIMVLCQSPDGCTSLAGSLSGSFVDRKHVVHGCSTIDPAATPDKLWQRLEVAWSAVPQRTHPKSL